MNAQPPKGRKPIYVTEYGVRGIYTGGKDQPGHLRDGTPVGDSNVNAFQHGWFNALSSQLGIKGAISWDAYSGGPGNQFGKFGMIADGHSDFRLKPSYFLTELFTHAMKPGWSAVHVAQAGKGELVTAFTGPRGESSVLALNQGATDKPFTFEGLKPGTTYHVASWNRRGGGGLAGEKDVVVSRAGTVSVAVPKGGVLALSTEPLKL